MKRIKLIFETIDEQTEKRFGYVIEPESLSYKTCDFDNTCEPQNISEHKPIGDLTAFGKKIWRLIRYALAKQ